MVYPSPRFPHDLSPHFMINVFKYYEEMLCANELLSGATHAKHYYTFLQRDVVF